MCDTDLHRTSRRSLLTFPSIDLDLGYRALLRVGDSGSQAQVNLDDPTKAPWGIYTYKPVPLSLIIGVGGYQAQVDVGDPSLAPWAHHDQPTVAGEEQQRLNTDPVGQGTSTAVYQAPQAR
jgi:hypothetical protein